MGGTRDGSLLSRLQNTDNLSNELTEIIFTEYLGKPLLWEACRNENVFNIISSDTAKNSFWCAFANYEKLGLEKLEPGTEISQIIKLFKESKYYQKCLVTIKINNLYLNATQLWLHPHLPHLQQHARDCTALFDASPIVARLCYVQNCIAQAKLGIGTGMIEATETFKKTAEMTSTNPDDLIVFMHQTSNVLFLGERVTNRQQLPEIFANVDASLTRKRKDICHTFR